MLSPRVIALVDVGKTHAKLVLSDAESGAIIHSAERANMVCERDGRRELDIDGVWRWLTCALAAAPERQRIEAIVPVGHGAAAVFLDANDCVLCAPDYEDPQFDAVAESYAALRDPFPDTLSPALPRGLNLGRQIHFIQTRAPEIFDRLRRILLYPQFWAWRLCGVRASEATSLGAHSDLWLPREGAFSHMAERMGWARLFPGVRPAAAPLGPLRPTLAAELGLDPACGVFCGLHDSNASYFCHRAARGEAPFTLASSGTWTILMASRGDLDRLREASDMLANVDAYGRPVATARVMGGREYAAIAGTDAPAADPSSLPALITAGVMALPSFALGGPFQTRRGTLCHADGLDRAGYAGLASLYLALCTDYMLDLLDVRGQVIVDGPLAVNAAYGGTLAALRPHDAITACAARTGTLAGARRLVRGEHEPPPALRPVAAVALPGLDEYRARWRAYATLDDSLRRAYEGAPVQDISKDGAKLR